jgi:hypothetical protein
VVCIPELPRCNVSAKIELHHLVLGYSICITYWLPPWSRVLLENLTGSHLVKKFPAFYEIRVIVTVFTSARHLFLSWTISIQSMHPNSNSWRFILILSSHPRLAIRVVFLLRKLFWLSSQVISLLEVIGNYGCCTAVSLCSGSLRFKSRSDTCFTSCG